MNPYSSQHQASVKKVPKVRRPLWPLSRSKEPRVMKTTWIQFCRQESSRKTGHCGCVTSLQCPLPALMWLNFKTASTRHSSQRWLAKPASAPYAKSCSLSASMSSFAKSPSSAPKEVFYSWESVTKSEAQFKPTKPFTKALSPTECAKHWLLNVVKTKCKQT